jgi:hypothetical protein
MQVDGGPRDIRGFATALTGDGRPLLKLTGIALVGSGLSRLSGLNGPLFYRCNAPDRPADRFLCAFATLREFLNTVSDFPASSHRFVANRMAALTLAVNKHGD